MYLEIFYILYSGIIHRKPKLEKTSALQSKKFTIDMFYSQAARFKPILLKILNKKILLCHFFALQ